MIIRYLLTLIFFLSSVGLGFSQQLTPAQKAEQEKQIREAQDALKKAFDPDNMARIFDEQIREARKNGATPAQIKELEEGKAEALKQLRAHLKEASQQKEQPAAQPADNAIADKPEADLMASLRRRTANPDSVPPIRNTIPGRYAGVPFQILFYAQAKLTPTRFVAFMQQQYSVQLKEAETYAGPDNQTYIRYDQVAGNYRVDPAYYTLQLNADGIATLATGQLFDQLPLPRTPAPTASQSLAVLTALLRAQGIDARDTSAVKLVAGPLLMKTGRQPDAPTFQVVYQYQVRPLKSYVYLDPVKKLIVYQATYIRTCRVPGHDHNQRNSTADDLEISPKKVKTFRFGEQTVNTKYGTYLIDLAEPNLYVHDIKGRTVTDTSAKWTNSSFTRAGYFDQIVALRGVMGMYRQQFNRRGYDDKNGRLFLEPLTDANAHWDEPARTLRFGRSTDGSPYISQDIAAHEFTHAVVDRTPAQLEYRGESGALNEAIADIMGSITDAKTGRGDVWRHGNQVPDGSGRNLANPHLSRQGAQPKTYEGKYWQNTNVSTYKSDNDYGGVHTNSGVISYWFYLLSEGGEGTNDLNDAYKVDRVGQDVAARIVYNALFQIGPTCDFKTFSLATETVAVQLHGEESAVTCSIRNAWYAVGVRDDEPPRCAPGWSFDMVMSNGTERVETQFYFKGDSAVAVTNTPDGIVKSFTSRSNPMLSMVVQNADGINTAVVPKSITQLMEKAVEETLPATELLMKTQLEEARAERNALGTSAERRAQLDAGIPVLEKHLNDMKQGRVEAEKTLDTLRQGEIPVSEIAFWQTRKARRAFDNDHIKARGVHEKLYRTRKYVLTEGKQGSIHWWTTGQIPLRMSDLMVMMPYSPVNQMRNGLDYWLRGFPIDYLGMFKIQNIRENVPGNFNALFSTAPIFK
ncbi:M4 family metallopeptidase [Fibrella aquatica]|uniref:M4 family metallopeptidase n=1 Tax=Fibrella aquatica TaxID=3242487 RepID=UPI0035200CC5